MKIQNELINHLSRSVYSDFKDEKTKQHVCIQYPIFCIGIGKTRSEALKNCRENEELLKERFFKEQEKAIKNCKGPLPWE